MLLDAFRPMQNRPLLQRTRHWMFLNVEDASLVGGSFQVRSSFECL